jgi:hypothetical protein
MVVPLTADADLPGFDDSTGLVEIRLGSYTPEIDEAVDGTPYQQAFGESMFLFELELDRQFWRGMGTLGYSLTIGYMNVDGRSLTSTGTDSPDETSLSVIPLRAGLVYRFDYLAQRFDVPLALSFKVGLDLYSWWITAGDNLATANGKTGDGVTLGYHYASGVYLLLDWFDESSADGLAFDFGVINSYLFTEIQRTEIDDFGESGSLRLSDTHYTFGFAFEY